MFFQKNQEQFQQEKFPPLNREKKSRDRIFFSNDR